MEANGAFRKRSPEWIHSKTPFSCCSVDDENGAFRKRSPEWIHWNTQFRPCCSVDGENGAFRKRSPEWIHSKTPCSCCSVDDKLSMRFQCEVSVFKRKRINVDVAKLLNTFSQSGPVISYLPPTQQYISESVYGSRDDCLQSDVGDSRRLLGTSPFPTKLRARAAEGWCTQYRVSSCA